MKATDRTKLRVLVLAAALAALPLTGRAQTPARTQVADVIVQGNRVVPTQRIMGMLKTRPGGDYVQETVNDDVRRLYAAGQFGNIQVQTQPAPEGKIVVYFVLVEYPSAVQEVVYNGAKHLKADELETLTGVRKGAPLNPIANKMACQAVVRRYMEMGRPLADCHLVEGDKPGDTRVVFNITEGPEIRVRKVTFTGNEFVSGPVLSTHINTSRQILGIFGGRFNGIVADLDVTKLEEYYRSFGFHDVKVSRELRYEPDGRHVTLIFHVNEGQRYRFGGATVEGVKKFPREEVERLVQVKQGDFFNQRRVDVDKQVIDNYYGYTGVNASTRTEFFYPPEQPGVCLVQYQVQERPPARVGQIYIVGNDKTRQDVILREVPLYPGQILSYPDMRLGERNLARRGIFEVSPEGGVRPTITVLDPESDTEFKDVLISVQETTTGSLIFGVGVNSDAGLTGQVVLNERNFDLFRPPTSFEDCLSGRAFRGGGQEFRAEAIPGTVSQRYSVSFREPSLFDSLYSLTSGFYYSTRRYDEYDESRLGTRWSVGRRINQYWRADVGLRVENVSISNVFPLAPEDFQEVRGDNFVVGFRGGVQYDSRDFYLRPTEGSLFEASVEQVLGEFTYPVITTEYQKYWTVYQRNDGSGRHVLSYKNVVGWAGANAPVYDRFFAGGYRTVRGFQFRTISPDKFGFKVGGDFQLMNSLEYDIPLVASDQIRFVGFVDSGTVERRLDINDYRVSAGFGFRFTVPMMGPVPIALDFGFPIVKGPNDTEQIFSFWLGVFR